MKNYLFGLFKVFETADELAVYMEAHPDEKFAWKINDKNARVPDGVFTAKNGRLWPTPKGE